MMKKGNLMKAVGTAFLAVFMTYGNAFAQDEVTDEELKQYAVVMDSIDAMKTVMGDKYNERIKAEELMDGGRRFKEIDDAKGDEAKLKAANITEEELTVYKGIIAYYDSLVANFKATYPELIKSDLLGASTYNKVKKALSDAAVKERYEAILNNVKEEEASAEASSASE